MKEIFCCPHCGAPLHREGRVARCAAGHSFDRAREGYYNLLPPGKGTHGDNRAMIEARRRFLAGGSYAFLAEAVASLACGVMPRDGVLLDAGAGEGYYTNQVARRLDEAEISKQFFAFDISKEAVRYAARLCPGVQCAVASSYRIPVLSGQVDLLLCLFAPFCREEFLRVLAPGGYLIMAIPEREHLFGLKAAIYDTPYKNEVEDYGVEGLQLQHTQRLCRTVTFDSQQTVADLFAMTPYAYRTSATGRERVAALHSLTTALDFRLFLYRRG